MGLLVWISVACAFLGGAGILWVEFTTYEERMRNGSEPWWDSGTHDEVETYPRRLFGPRESDGGE